MVPMIHLTPVIERIKALLAEDSDASVTYAALEARLALERVVYDRLRQRHDYISHAQLRKWQPGGVIKQLITDVDANVSQTMSLHIGGPASERNTEDDDYIEVGTEVGFDAKRIERMWNALAKLALHVRLPKNSDDAIPDYGDRMEIKAKVEEVLAELERLSKGTMTFSGIGVTVSFPCECGETNKRRAELLEHGQIVHCINPDCRWSWTAHKVGNEFRFESLSADFTCQGCGVAQHLPWRAFFTMRYDERASFLCSECGYKNFVIWGLKQVIPKESADGPLAR